MKLRSECVSQQQIWRNKNKIICNNKSINHLSLYPRVLCFSFMKMIYLSDNYRSDKNEKKNLFSCLSFGRPKLRTISFGLTIAIKQPWDDSIIVNMVATCRFPRNLEGKEKRGEERGEKREERREEREEEERGEFN